MLRINGQFAIFQTSSNQQLGDNYSHFKPRSNVSFYWQVGLLICSESAGHAIMHSSFRPVCKAPYPPNLQILRLANDFLGEWYFWNQKSEQPFSW